MQIAVELLSREQVPPFWHIALPSDEHLSYEFVFMILDRTKSYQMLLTNMTRIEKCVVIHILLFWHLSPSYPSKQSQVKFPFGWITQVALFLQIGSPVGLHLSKKYQFQFGAFLMFIPKITYWAYLFHNDILQTARYIRR